MLWAVVACLCWSSSAGAEITYRVITPEGMLPHLLILGNFEPSDDSDQLALEVAASGAKAVILNSTGGNMEKAMEYGRQIRSLGLFTHQVGPGLCYFVCVYAFMGGVERYAGHSALALDQAMLTPTDTPVTVESLHDMSRTIIAYSKEMGVDPDVMLLVPTIAGDEPRYLSKSELEKYKLKSMGRLPKALSSATTASGTKREFTTAYDAEKSSNDIENRAANFLFNYMRYSGSNTDRSIGFFRRVYADSVETDDGDVSKVALLERKRQEFAEWPKIQYVVDKIRSDVICMEQCLLVVHADWFKMSESSDRIVSGVSAFVIEWDPDTGIVSKELVRTIVDGVEDDALPIVTIAHLEALRRSCERERAYGNDISSRCTSHDAITAALKDNGWCYDADRRSERGKGWSLCGAASASIPVAINGVTDEDRALILPSSLDYPAIPYKGKTVFPDFKRRDGNISFAEALVREVMGEGPNFGGHYSLIDPVCSDGPCPAFAVDHKTGKPIFLPAAKNQKRIRLAADNDTRLIIVQSLYADSDSCIIDFLEISDDQKNHPGWTPINSFNVGNAEACKRTIKENLTQ